MVKKLNLLFALICSVFLVTGCQGTNETNEANNLNNSRNQNNQFMHVKNSPVDDISLEDSQQISQYLANLASSVPEVENAVAVALGRYVIVGIDVEQNLDRSKVGSIKYTVAEALKKDRYGANAIVVADPDLTARLREIRNDIQEGRPIQGILNELSAIIGRMMPEVPGDIQERRVEEEMEEQKQGMDNNNERKLEKSQNEQSNHLKNK